MENTAGKRTSQTSRKGKCLPRKVKDLSKEELLLTLKKKRECNAKALTIVEGMLEPDVKEDWLLDVLHHINQSHLQDVTEERAIINLCGYPLCSNELKNIPSQQFRISTRANKVYDIKDRKNFCSNKCFKACKFIKDQMLTSPLWLRDIEPSIKFILMPSAEMGGGVGDEVNVQIERVSKSEITEISGEQHSSFSKQTDRNPPLVDVLSNLHIIANMRENTPLNFSDGLNGTETEEKKDLQQNKTTEENSTASDERDEVELEDTCKIGVQGGILKKESECQSSDFQDSPLNFSKTDTCEVFSSTTAQENLSEKVIATDDDEMEKLGIGANSEETALFTSDTSSIPVSMLSSASCDPGNLTDSLKNSPKNVTTKTGLPDEKNSEIPVEQTTERSEYLNVKSNIGNDRISAGFINQTYSSSSKSCVQLPSTSKENEERNLENPVDSTILHREESNTATRQCCIKKRPERLQKKNKLDYGSSKTISTVAHVEKCMREWFSLETMCFLYGETALKNMLEHKGESIQEHYNALNSITWDQEKHDRFLAICKRLSLLEMEDSNFDTQVMKSESDSIRKPLPNYEVLKREAEAMQLKVNAFYQGKMEIDEKKVSFAQDVKTDSVDSGKDSEAQIPLVHLHSQRALRKKIVLDGLNRVLPDFLRTFGMRPSDLTSSIRGLVSTFSLSATNITFKPYEWSLLGLIVIKLLTLRETELRQRLQQEQSNTYLTLMLMSYKQEPGYLDRLLSWLTDIDVLLARPQS